MTPDESFAAFAERVYVDCPDQQSHAMKIDVRDLALTRRRATCGLHGRIIPTRAGVCPQCAGYVEPIDERKVRLIRRAWEQLNGIGATLILVEIRAPEFHRVVPVIIGVN